MCDPILTPRLQLIPLSLHELELLLQNIEAFETSMQIQMMREQITESVCRALRMKIGKMQKAEASQRDWFTYWLVVIQEGNVGAGLVGFKGFPDGAGSTEIGYGLDPAYQGKGYMSEAIQGLVDWAFAHPFCRVITASEVENPASRRLLERLGAQLLSSSEHSTSWEIRKMPK